MLDAVAAKGGGWVDLVTAHRHAAPVRFGRGVLAQRLAGVNIGLDEVVAEIIREADLAGDLGARAHRRAHLPDRAIAIEQVTGEEQAWPGAAAGVDRLALLEHIAGHVAGGAHRGDAIGKIQAAEAGAVLLDQMLVHVHQAGHDGELRGIDHASDRRARAVRLDGDDAVALDHDIDVGPGVIMHAVDQLSGMDRHSL